METGKLVGIIRGATEEVFSMMLGLSVECGEWYHEDTADESFDGVVALIGLAGAWVGAGRLSCSSKLARHVSGALLASEYPAVNEEVLDAIAEVSNMIIGNVKSQIEEDYGSMGLSIPTVIYGRNYKARSASATGWTVVPFDCAGERLDVKICLTPGTPNGPLRADSVVHQTL